MGYQALLFCPDEKAARGVTQVLNELDFTVEPCTEPFAAVKKLMAQHFDAIVVDCDNEQNATLLFKSARNSSSNQSSLAVAVVEGQAGVAKAFRIGANLVLTKPINIEQAKGTLRVARGLLRKGGETPKPATDAAGPAASATASPKPATAPRPFPPVAPQASSTPKPAAGLSKPVAPVRTPPPVEPEAPTTHTPVALNSSSVPASKSASPAAQGAGSQKKYPWQASKSVGEPMASALKKAAEAAGIATTPEPHPAPAPAVEAPFAAAPTTLSSAAAPAPAREKVSAPAPEQKEIVHAEPTPSKQIVAAPEPKFAEVEIDPPSFSMGAPAVDEEEPGNSKKALIIVAVVVILASLAGYLAWKNMSDKAPAVTPAPQTQGPATSSATPAATDNSAVSNSAAANTPAPIASSSPAETSNAPAPVKPSPKAIAKDTFTSAPVAAPSSQPAETPAAPALVVHHESSRPAAKPSASDADNTPAPAALDMAASPDSHALAVIGNAPVAVPKASASTQVLKISQGVSEGLVLKRVTPRYPAQAIQMRLEGAVQLQATIGRDGSISNLKTLSGDAMLARAAQDAVKQWKYKPYYLNGEPVEIQTQITVNFKLPR